VQPGSPRFAGEHGTHGTAGERAVRHGPPRLL